MQEFRVNDFLTLKLENNKTYIYIKGEQFRQCMYLLANKKVDELEDLLTLDSVDDMVDDMDHSLAENSDEIPPETEFWGHCSNLQVWYENDYDTRMIHSNLAFPLLKELSDAGEVIAKKVFREEIAKRIESGNFQVITFLIEEGYINYLNREDFLFCILNHSDADIIYKLEEELDIVFNVSLSINDSLSNSISIENKNVVDINFEFNKISQKVENIFECLAKLKNLEILSISNSDLTFLSLKVGKLKNLMCLELCNNQIITIPDSIGKLRNLTELNLAGNQIVNIPDLIGDLINLKRVNLGHNQIVIIPNSIGKLKKLETLDLRHNQISTIPNIIGNLKSLYYIYLQENRIKQPKIVREMLLKNNRLRNVRI